MALNSLGREIPASFAGRTLIPYNDPWSLQPHAERNMVPLRPDRFSLNQDAMVRLLGWAGNMTISNSFLQGVLTT